MVHILSFSTFSVWLYVLTWINPYLLNWIAAYLKAPSWVQSSTFSTHDHSLASQYGFPSLRWWHPVVCFFLLRRRLGIAIYNISNIKKCLNDIHLLMTANKLKQTEPIYFYSKHSPQKSFITLHFGADLIQPSQHVRDIGANLTVLFLCYPRLTPSVSQLSIKCGTLLALGSIYLPRPLSSLTFVSSKLDFCNSLLYGILKRLLRKLQSVQNPAERLVTSSSKVDHIIPLLMQLHWLPIAERIKFNCSFNLQRPPRPIAFLHQRTPYFVTYCTHALIIIYLTFSPDWL